MCEGWSMAGKNNLVFLAGEEHGWPLLQTLLLHPAALHAPGP